MVGRPIRYKIYGNKYVLTIVLILCKLDFIALLDLSVVLIKLSHPSPELLLRFDFFMLARVHNFYEK